MNTPSSSWLRGTDPSWDTFLSVLAGYAAVQLAGPRSTTPLCHLHPCIQAPSVEDGDFLLARRESSD